LREFDGHVLRLAQIINRAEPERFARTSVALLSSAAAVAAAYEIEHVQNA
jgi:hypothetical protein